MTLKTIVRMGAAASALLLTAQASAADLSGFRNVPPPVRVPHWSGCYLGANGGYGWRDTNDQFANAIVDPAFAGIGAEGGFGGGQIGCNWQGFLGAPLVVGLEADIQGADIKGGGADADGGNYTTDLDWFGTVRGRIGYAASNALVYFTGGLAYGGLKQHAEDTSGPAVYETSDTVTGYVLGGGVEYKFNPSWSVKAEYQYLNFGKNDAALVGGGSTAAADGFHLSDDAFHTVRVGVNYWANPAYTPLK